MDVTLAKKDLLRLFSRTQGVAEKKSTMPILSNVLVQAEGGVLRASATDLYMAVTASVPAQVAAAGLIAVPAKDLIERLKAMPEGPVQIRATEGSTALIKAVHARREFRLRGMPGEDFPQLPKPEATARPFLVSPSVMAELITKTQFSISGDETRPHLNSALFEGEAGLLRMVTTDGHRLSKHEIACEMGEVFTMLVPQKGITELRRLCDELVSAKTDAQLQMVRSGPNVFFLRGNPDQPGETEDSLLAVKLVEAPFPPYQQVIPQRSEHSARINRTTLVDTLKAMSIAASERTGSVKLSLSKDLLRVSSENPDSGDAHDEIAVDYPGKDLTIGFNVRYLLDVLAALSDEEDIRLGLSGELDPIVVTPASDRRFLAIVMPMRI